MAQSVTLIKVNAGENNNKFYELTLDDNGTVTARYGRVGSTGTKRVAGHGEAAYKRVLREKTRKGYKEAATVDSGASRTAIDSAALKDATRKGLATPESANNEAIGALLDTLVTQNRHQIVAASDGMIEVNDDGVLKTPLGIITRESIASAREILKKIAAASSKETKTYVANVEEFLTLVPQKVPSKRGWHSSFFTDESIPRQNDFLDQLEGSYDWWEQQQETAKHAANSDTEDQDYSSLFRYRLGVVEDPEALAHVDKYFKASVNGNHPSRHLKLKRIYAINDTQGVEKFSQASQSYGNERELWHGTRVGNVLSILSKGLYVPPMHGGSIQTTGRMFGDGVYFSEQSTKSLNYSHGVWAGQRENHCFMFLADVVLGKMFSPVHGIRGAYDGKHHSIYVDPNIVRSVRNNEVIVWNTDQISLKYLCEFDR